MNIDDLKIKKNGSVTIDSIFEFNSSMEITLLVNKCQTEGCTLRFKNEDLTIDNTYNNDPGMRAKVLLYSLLASYPEAAMDYIRGKR